MVTSHKVSPFENAHGDKASKGDLSPNAHAKGESASAPAFNLLCEAADKSLKDSKPPKQQKVSPIMKKDYPTPPTRPYSEYNVFFNLERNYILQKIYSVAPEATSDNIFDPSDPEYKGPPLPKRYREVVLAKWFYSSYKEKQIELEARRRHRATHGKIKFTDLSKMISNNWKNADVETKEYCRTMRELDGEEFRRRKKRYALAKAAGYADHPKPKGPILPKSTSAIKYSQAAMKKSKSSCGHNEYRFSQGSEASFIEDAKAARNNEATSTHRFAASIVGYGVEKGEEFGCKARLQQSSERKLPFFHHPHSNNSSFAQAAPDDKQNYQSPRNGQETKATARGSVLSPYQLSTQERLQKDGTPTRFNIFCQLEKAYILQKEMRLLTPIPGSAQFDSKAEGFGNIHLPARYQGLVLPPKFYNAYDNDELILMMHFQLELPNGIKCAFDISNCLGRRWRGEIDDEVKSYCEFIHLALEKRNLIASGIHKGEQRYLKLPPSTAASERGQRIREVMNFPTNHNEMPPVKRYRMESTDSPHQVNNSTTIASVGKQNTSVPRFSSPSNTASTCAESSESHSESTVIPHTLRQSCNTSIAKEKFLSFTPRILPNSTRGEDSLNPTGLSESKNGDVPPRKVAPAVIENRAQNESRFIPEPQVSSSAARRRLYALEIQDLEMRAERETDEFLNLIYGVRGQQLQELKEVLLK